MCGSDKKAIDLFQVSKSTYYHWKKKYKKGGYKELIRQTPDRSKDPRCVPEETIELVLKLRKEQKIGSKRIVWYLERYHGVTVSESSVTRILTKHGMARLKPGTPKRRLHSKRYNKKSPGHHVRIDVKINIFIREGRKIKRFQYTAIDDATRIRALKIYDRHTQANAIDFVDYVIKLFPFRINNIRTDNGHEFQAKFHWHVEDLGMKHSYIKPGTPQLNGKVERSHRTDRKEFYQLLEYTNDVDLNRKLKDWETFYNYHRPHGAHEGKTPYEKLKSSILND
ncbi:IS481 family transposase [Schleiferiaceae bacterium]|jgi:transposase InsO family protein|nr:IS481 family transposase [Schleiferiaceae bacterium]MDA8819695.1 IS481 family transposase [Schleiferiaceae bacterium]